MEARRVSGPLRGEVPHLCFAILYVVVAAGIAVGFRYDGRPSHSFPHDRAAPLGWGDAATFSIAIGAMAVIVAVFVRPTPLKLARTGRRCPLDGFPAVALPAGVGGNTGLPISVSLIDRSGAGWELLSLGRALQDEFGLPEPPATA